MLIFLIFSLFVGVFGQKWEGKNYPNPREDFEKCGNRDARFVCDPNGVLTVEDRERLHFELINETKSDIPLKFTPHDACPLHQNEIEFYTAFARRIETLNNHTEDTDLIRFVNSLTKKYGLDDQKCRNYILILVVTDEMVIYAKTGDHLDLPDEIARQFFHVFKVHFELGEYREGIHALAGAIMGKLVGKAKLKSEMKIAMMPWWIWLIIAGAILLILIILLLTLLYRRQNKRQSVTPKDNELYMYDMEKQENNDLDESLEERKYSDTVEKVVAKYSTEINQYQAILETISIHEEKSDVPRSPSLANLKTLDSKEDAATQAEAAFAAAIQRGTSTESAVEFSTGQEENDSTKMAKLQNRESVMEIGEAQIDEPSTPTKKAHVINRELELNPPVFHIDENELYY